MNYKQLIFLMLALNVPNFFHAMQDPNQPDSPALPAFTNCLFSYLYSSPRVQIPPYYLLKERFTKAGLGDFFEITEVKDICEQTKWANEIPARIRMSLTTYASKVKPDQLARVEARKDEIARLILKDHPAAIASLEQQGWIQ